MHASGLILEGNLMEKQIQGRFLSSKRVCIGGRGKLLTINVMWLQGDHTENMEETREEDTEHPPVGSS